MFPTFLSWLTSSKAEKLPCSLSNDCSKWDTELRYTRLKPREPGIYAMRMALGLLKREGTTEAMDAALTTFRERDQIVGLDDWQRLEQLYMDIRGDKS